MRRLCISMGTIMLCCCSLTLHASLPINIEGIKNSVVFLFDRTSPSLKDQRTATGFLIWIPIKANPNLGSYTIVTARHVVDPQWAGCKRENPQRLFARVNKRNYKPEGNETGVQEYPIDLISNNHNLWFASSDDKVDAAVIPIANSNLVNDNDVTAIGLSELGSSEEIQKFKIGIGDGLVSAGLVPSLVDNTRNYPAFKFGTISSVPQEPLRQFQCEEGAPTIPTWGWLMAGNFVPGNSGSPVFLLPVEIQFANGIAFNGPRPMFIGLVSGTIQDADLAEMVPVEFLFTIIQQHYPDRDLYRGNLKDKSKPGEDLKK